MSLCDFIRGHHGKAEGRCLMIDENALDLARTVDLPSFLETELGLTPVTVDGNGRFYLSPFGDEKTPSFHVSYRDGVWLWYGTRPYARWDRVALTFVPDGGRKGARRCPT